MQCLGKLQMASVDGRGHEFRGTVCLRFGGQNFEWFMDIVVKVVYVLGMIELEHGKTSQCVMCICSLVSAATRNYRVEMRKTPSRWRISSWLAMTVEASWLQLTTSEVCDTCMCTLSNPFSVRRKSPSAEPQKRNIMSDLCACSLSHTTAIHDTAFISIA